MRKLKVLATSGACVVVMLVMAVVSMFAATSATASITATVSYTPQIRAKIKFASNTSTFSYGVDEFGIGSFDDSATYYYNNSTDDINDFVSVSEGVATETAAPRLNQSSSLCIFDNTSAFKTGSSLDIYTLDYNQESDENYFSNAIGVLTFFFEVTNYTVAYDLYAKVDCGCDKATYNITYYTSDGEAYARMPAADYTDGVITPTKALIAINFTSASNFTPSLSFKLSDNTSFS
ncbi:MAG: hypothetical protein IJA22_00815 [Clostridia bacterium]|nr:hypothetical protein [Clostridia bacterium]